MKIEIDNRQNNVRINKKEIGRVAKAALRQLGLPEESVVSLSLVSPAEIKKINKLYFGRNSFTDVIAIEPGGQRTDIYKHYIGDIVICPDIARSNSKRFNTSVKKEIALYIIHGILHLSGYNDINKKRRLMMQRKEKEILNKL